MTVRKIACLMVFFTYHKLVAQTPPTAVKPATITNVTKFRPPAVRTFLGRNSQTADVTVEEANQLVNLPLKITDDKNNAYTVSSYQFMYKRKSVVRNEETGKKEVVFTTVADLFKITPLPQVWRNNIGGGMQKDEELYFFDIIVKDKLDRKFFAPDVRIRVQ